MESLFPEETLRRIKQCGVIAVLVWLLGIVLGFAPRKITRAAQPNLQVRIV